jgi:hypothetical protein
MVCNDLDLLDPDPHWTWKFLLTPILILYYKNAFFCPPPPPGCPVKHITCLLQVYLFHYLKKNEMKREEM